MRRADGSTATECRPGAGWPTTKVLRVSPLVQRLFLAVFVIVDVILVVGAVRHVNPDQSEAAATDITAPVDATATSPTATTGADGGSAASSAAPAQLPYDFSPGDAVALSSALDGTIIYGSRGRCADPAATVQVSTDGGADFSSASTGLSMTLAARASSASSITVVGTTDDCRDVRQVTSTNGGRSWTPDAAVALWYPSPKDPSSVVSPRGSSKPGEGCVVTSVNQVTADSARVSCADGTIKGSGDGGGTWVDLGRLDNLRVTTFTTPSAGLALARYNGCGANLFATSDGGVTWTPGGCISGEPAQAVAATANGLTAVVNGEVYVSEDSGKTFKQP